MTIDAVYTWAGFLEPKWREVAYQRPPSSTEHWITESRAWNETYALERDMPLCLKSEGGSVWPRRLR